MLNKIINTIFNINETSVKGKSIVIKNGQIWIDGKEINTTDKVINIEVTGNVEKIDVDFCNQLTIKGNCNSVSSTSADVKVDGYVHGDVNTTSGDVKSNDIHGSVKTVSGDVEAGKIGGDTSTVSGDIKKLS